MPEQPDDPIHYDMRIPPEPDPNKQRAPEKNPSDQKENESDTARDSSTVRRDDQPQSVGGEK